MKFSDLNVFNHSAPKIDYAQGTLNPHVFLAQYNQVMQPSPKALALYDKIENYRDELELNGRMPTSMRYKFPELSKSRYARYAVFPTDQVCAGTSILVIGYYSFQKDGSIWIRLCPMPRSIEEMWIVRRHLCGALGTHVADMVFDQMKITRLDIAIDSQEINNDHYLFHLAGSAKYEPTEDGVLYLGSIRSGVFVRIYDKRREQADRKGIESDSPLYRVEFVIRPEVSISKLGVISNPLQRLHCYRKEIIQQEFGTRFVSDWEAKGCVYATKTASAGDANKTRRITRRIKQYEVSIFQDVDQQCAEYRKSLYIFDPLKPNE